MSLLPLCLKKTAPAILLMTSGCWLSSCGESGIARTVSKPYQAIADLIPRRVPIAEVRPEDLRKMPTGAERAQAWDRRLDARRYAYGRWVAPKHYKAPKLPDARGLPAGEGLLPPLQAGQDTNPQGSEELPRD